MQTYGEFIKEQPGGKRPLRRTAYSPIEAVKFRFDGWKELPGEPTPAAPPALPGPEPKARQTTPKTPPATP